MSYQVTIKPSGHTYSVANEETVLNAAIDAGFNLPYGCRNGACGACKGKVIEGKECILYIYYFWFCICKCQQRN